jgi:N-acetylglucosamine-6-phosphate deacetylase
MILLSGATVVLPDRLISPATVALDGSTIADIVPGTRAGGEDETYVDCSDRYVVPGFIDVHVHGVEGSDTLDGAGAIARIAERLPRYGVTAFCPTSLACSPPVLRTMLDGVRAARTSGPGAGARVLPAHLESNFINPDFRGAQPLECLRVPYEAAREGEFSGAEILQEIAEARPDVGIITVAPEMSGALELIRDLVSNGHHVSLGHSGATYEQAIAGIEAGARQATHLYNRMTPIAHRAPGLAAAVLEHEDVTAEVVCDGVHVHPAMVKIALSAKQPSGIMAITDGTAGGGLPRGARAAIGGRAITVGDAAYLDDGTLAGSVLTMDRAFGRLVTSMGVGLVEAVTICATTPARALGLQRFGVMAPGSTADVVVLDRDLTVWQTYIDGRLAWART